MNVTLETPSVNLKGKRVKVYQKPFTKEDYEGIAIIKKELNEIQFGKVIYNCCEVVFGLEKTKVVRTISKEDIF